MMLQTGHGGSVPEVVMRTGVILPFNPRNIRRQVSVQHVIDQTSLPAGVNPASVMPVLPQPLPPAPPGPTTAAVAATTTATPPAPVTPATPTKALGFPFPVGQPEAAAYSGQLGQWRGRPMATFQINSAPPAGGAQSAASALRRAAHMLRQAGYGSLPPELIAGPLSALMRGGAVELHFQNGVVVRTAL